MALPRRQTASRTIFFAVVIAAVLAAFAISMAHGVCPVP
jgi:hypothetical protein